MTSPVDYKARAAGDEDPPSAPSLPRPAPERERAPLALPYAPTRPAFCNGGMYVGGYAEADRRPLISKTRGCDEQPDRHTGLCATCAKREADARRALHDWQNTTTPPATKAASEKRKRLEE